MATQAQYDAATKALETMAYNLINQKVPEFEQAFAKLMADQMCPQAAKVAVDAAEAAAS